MSGAGGSLPNVEIVKRLDDVLAILFSGRISNARDELKYLREQIITGAIGYRPAVPPSPKGAA